MIFQLDTPFVFLGMGIGFVVGVLLHNLAQVLTARALGDPVTRMARRQLIAPKREFDAFGVIAMVVGGVGWGRPVEMAEPRTRGGRRGRFFTALLAGPAADIVVGLALVATYAAVTSSSGRGIADAPGILYAAGVTCASVGVLHLIPLPPLDMARIMWVLAPPTPGWQKARYNLEEQNWGVGALVVLSLPLFGSGQGLIIRMVDAVVRPLITPILNAFG